MKSRHTRANSEARIVDITINNRYCRYLYKCLAPMPFRRYKHRQEYLEKAIPRGFHKDLLIVDEGVVGTIEFAPAESCGYPIMGKNIVVMNCIWVLRKARMRGFGSLLVEHMLKSEKNACGFATIALENHWSPWFKKDQTERLGFTSIDFVEVVHKAKRAGHVFKVHLMWMPTAQGAREPRWNKKELLLGETFCMAHPLYRPQNWEGKILMAKQTGPVALI